VKGFFSRWRFDRVNPLKLLEPIKVGGLELRNRIVMPAMGTNYAGPDGAVSDRLLHYYIERAKGGTGLIIIEVTCIDSPIGKTIAHQLCVHEDRLIAGLRTLAGSIQAHGAKVALQLHHAGRRAPSKITGLQPVAPSAIACYGGSIPKELTEEEIEEVFEKFADGARRAQEAGFDAVEVHCAHGYLIHQFLSPLTNERTDGYGGELENRAKFACEVIHRIKKEVGEGYPISVRISGDEFLPGGLTLVEGKIIAQELQKAGASIVHVSAGGTPSSVEEYMAQKNSSIPDMSFPRGCFVPLAQGIKESVDLPVIAVGRINEPDLAEEILRLGRADLVSMGRALIADPEMPRKVKEGSGERVRRCIACMTCVEKILVEQSPMVCTVNPAAGKEKESKIARAKTPKEVLVVGGGPAGMEAARVLSLRGHRVTLMEKSNQLGGQLKWAALPPHKEGLRDLLNYYSGQMRDGGVKVELCSWADSQAIAERKAQAVILATGAKPMLPEWKGGGKGNLFNFAEALTSPSKIGEKVIVLGGGMIGCETAEFLARRGKSVTIIEMLKDVALDVNPFVRKALLSRLQELKVSLVTNTRVIQIDEDRIIGVTNGEERTFQGDSLIIAMGMDAERAWSGSREEKLPGYYEIGDCLKPRKLIEAIHEGFSLGLKI
jgi:2,4-dienoyl-CoA reductase-like NADH-dependent reductase (Old Yellow Enzyme family)/thioredoxin reductase